MGSGRSWWNDVAHGAASSFHAILKTASLSLALVTLSVTASLAQSVSVSASPATFNAEGDVIRFDYVIDPGSYTITGINPTSTSIKGASVSCPSLGGGLEYPNKLTCTATYSVDSLDVMSGQFSDFATFTGTRIGGNGSVTMTSNTVVVRAAAGGPVIISVTSSPNPSQPGEEVAVTATVSSMGCNAGQSPPGSVTISIGSQSESFGLLPTAPVSAASSATFRTSSLASGTYPISASYSGGSGCSTGTGSGSNHTVETKPTVTINQAASQADPTSRSPIMFDVIFDKPIVGFSSADVQLSGTAGATSVAITGSGPSYSIAVSGMSGAGTVTATIPAGSVTTPAGLGNEASTSSDNSVTYDPINITPIATDGAVTVAADSSGNPVPLNLSGGQADTIIVVAGPSHGTATVTGVALTYSPAGGYSGPDSITYTASNSAGSSTATITITVTPPPGALSLSPAGGALKDAMAGEAYSQAITASGGTAPLIYSLAGGTLPRGMVLNLSTGELTGPLETETEGDYSFTVQVRDARGDALSAAYTLKVTPREVNVTDREISVAPGAAPPNVNLAAGATGGPFTAADLTFVSPPNAGRASIVNGEFAQAHGPQATGFYLKFIPNPAFSGQARVGFRLTSALGSSNQGTITYKLGYDAAQVANEINDLVHGFVSTRQNLIASTVKIPGLLERRQMANATEAVTSSAAPSGDGMVFGFSTSLAQIEAARNKADGVTKSELPEFNIWLDGTFLVHNREESGSKWGSFAKISAGADYLISDKALLGFSFHFDRMTDPTDGDNELTGNGWLVGPNASLEIAKGIFWNSSLLYGGSANDIDTPFWDGSFDTTRWLFDTSISGRWDIDDVTTFTPKLRGVYFSETVDDYAVANGAGDRIDLEGFREEQLRVSLGAEVARQVALENGSIVTPKFGGTVGVSGLDGTGAFGSITTGVSMETVENWSVDAALLLNFEGDGETSAGAKLGVSKKF